jgi:hypothetical protein
MFGSNLIAVDTQKVKFTKTLPPDMDMNIFNLGLIMNYIPRTTTKPKKGWELYSALWRNQDDQAQ